MPRCLSSVVARVAATSALTLAVTLPAMAQLQVNRSFPLSSLRGELLVTVPPEALLNGQPIRLAPGARLRGPNNLLLVSGALAGQKLKVNYTVDQYNLLSEVWVLRDDELARLWPTKPEEAAKWSYDPINQTWIKP